MGKSNRASILSRVKNGAGLSAIAVSLSLVSFTGAAWAQATSGGAEQQQVQRAEEGEESTATSRDIVVTGTLIRGVAPAGSNTIDITNADTKLSGVIDGNALLTQVPQAEGFMNVNQFQPGRGGNNVQGLTRVPVVRPNLRNLGDSFQGSGSQTLVLMDGHRIVPSGIEQSVVDVGSIPSGILDRTEIVLDGTSAVYGSDAVGGTINYVPRKRFDDTRVSATYGFADDYWSTSVDVSTGVTWEGGGIGFGYSFGKNSNLLTGERDWTIPHNYIDPVAPGRLTGLACEGYGHAVVGTRRFIATAGSTALPEGSQWCELGLATAVQALERHSGFVTFSQDITDTIRFEVEGFYTQRFAAANGGPFTSGVVISPTNPFYRPIIAAGISPTANQTVNFSWAPIYGNEAAETTTKLRLGQVSPSVRVDLGGDWQVRVMGAYGKSKVEADQATLDTVLVNRLITATTTTTAINPYDIKATPNPALFSNLIWHNVRDGVHTFYQARTVADGPLFHMAGGDVRVAVGAEWNKTDFRRRSTDMTTHILGPYASASVTNKAVFAELNVPFVGPDNAMPGIHSLTLSASGRYDHYNVTGGTFNPKIAATYQPVDWVSIRGNWGKSFRAPNAVDRLGASANLLQCSSNTDIAGCVNIGNFFTVPTGTVLNPALKNVIVSLAGTAANVKPETSKNWAIGADIRPPVLPGLQISATYWNIKFTNQIRFPPTNINDKILGAPDTVILNPSPAQIETFAKLAPNGALIADVVLRSPGGAYNVLYLSDASITNLASVKVSGLDLSARYSHPVSFGSLDASFNGTWQLNNKVKVAPASPVTDALRVDTPIFTMSATAGVNIGDFRAQVIFQHRSGYDVDVPPLNPNRDPNQPHIGSFNLWNAAFRYNVSGKGLAQDLVFTVVVNNIFNTAPPINRTNNGSTTNGSTLGRFIQFGIEKAF